MYKIYSNINQIIAGKQYLITDEIPKNLFSDEYIIELHKANKVIIHLDSLPKEQIDFNAFADDTLKLIARDFGIKVTNQKRNTLLEKINENIITNNNICD